MNLPSETKLVFCLLPERKGGIRERTVTLICIIRCAKMQITYTTIQLISSETAIRNTVKQSSKLSAKIEIQSWNILS
jgi:hypothetical protein